MKILIVDDAMFMRITLKNLLVKEGYECFEAASGKEAVARYQELKPQLVTMDITMPEMDGIEASRAIKQLDPEATIIMCSAMGQESMVVDAIQAGATDFIVKPFRPERVLEAVVKACGRPSALV